MTLVNFWNTLLVFCRSCTDVICCLLFVIYVLFMLGIGIAGAIWIFNYVECFLKKVHTNTIFVNFSKSLPKVFKKSFWFFEITSSGCLRNQSDSKKQRLRKPIIVQGTVKYFVRHLLRGVVWTSAHGGVFRTLSNIYDEAFLRK